jgi:hypothetical protein
MTPYQRRNGPCSISLSGKWKINKVASIITPDKRPATSINIDNRLTYRSTTTSTTEWPAYNIARLVQRFAVTTTACFC